MFKPTSSFAGRAMAVGIVGLLASASRVHPQTSSPVERAGQLIADAQTSLTRIRDYTGTLVREERIGGQLQPEQFIDIKIRQHPYSADLKWTWPKHLVGQEAIFVAGKNNNEIRAKGTGILAIAGYVSLPINDPRVMRNSRHPITDTGIGHLLEILSRSYEIEKRMPAGAVKVSFAQYAFEQRRCTRMEVTNTVFNAQLYCHRCVVYFDSDNKLPVRVEVYDWPTAKGDPNGELLERYSYTNLKFNVGLTDASFTEPDTRPSPNAGMRR